jgi:hypothetical protein
MTRHALLLVVGLAAVLLALPAARAQTAWRWVDEAGEVHYTDNKGSIPADRRKAAQVTQGAEIGIAPARAPSAEAGDAPAQVDDDAAEKAKVQEEQDWRARFKEKRDRVERLERVVKADRKILEDPNSAGLPVGRIDRHGVVQPSPELQAVKKRVEAEEKQLAEAREALNDLDREAAGKAVPLEWRR